MDDGSIVAARGLELGEVGRECRSSGSEGAGSGPSCDDRGGRGDGGGGHCWAAVAIVIVVGSAIYDEVKSW